MTTYMNTESIMWFLSVMFLSRKICRKHYSPRGQSRFLIFKQTISKETIRSQKLNYNSSWRWIALPSKGLIIWSYVKKKQRKWGRGGRSQYGNTKCNYKRTGNLEASICGLAYALLKRNGCPVDMEKNFFRQICSLRRITNWRARATQKIRFVGSVFSDSFTSKWISIL